MMTLEDYALDVDKTVEEIMALCDKIGINYEDGNSLLDDISITLLDNELQDEEDYVGGDEEDLEEQRIEEEVADKAEELASNTRIDLDDTTSFTKVKQTKEAKKTIFKCMSKFLHGYSKITQKNLWKKWYDLELIRKKTSAVLGLRPVLHSVVCICECKHPHLHTALCSAHLAMCQHH